MCQADPRSDVQLSHLIYIYLNANATPTVWRDQETVVTPSTEKADLQRVNNVRMAVHHKHTYITARMEEPPAKRRRDMRKEYNHTATPGIVECLGCRHIVTIYAFTTYHFDVCSSQHAPRLDDGRMSQAVHVLDGGAAHAGEAAAAAYGDGGVDDGAAHAGADAAAGYGDGDGGVAGSPAPAHAGADAAAGYGDGDGGVAGSPAPAHAGADAHIHHTHGWTEEEAMDPEEVGDTSCHYLCHHVGHQGSSSALVCGVVPSSLYYADLDDCM